MFHLRRLVLRLVSLFRKEEAERRLAREVASHLSLLEEEYQRRGLTAEDARLAARRAFGGVEQTKEAQRDARSFTWIGDAWHDIGYGLRTLRRTPAFTAVAILTLALGVGAVTVIYSVVRNVLLDPFPYPHSDRMVDVFVRRGSGDMLRHSLPVPEFLDFQEQSQVFEDVVGVSSEGMHLTTDTGAESVRVVSITPNTFEFLGVAPLIGRCFGPSDAEGDAAAVAVLNHRAWTSLFGGDAGVVGRTIRLNGSPRTIIGVMPPRFEWNIADFWIPSAPGRAAPDAAETMRTFQARLRPGVTVEEAQAQLQVIAARRAAYFPRDYPDGSWVQV
ncbi:MAG: ABC transporter permease, partial [Vicinamibacterales bacterium]